MQFNQCCHSLQSYDYLQYPALAVHPARYASWLHAVSLSYPIPHYSSFTKTISRNYPATPLAVLLKGDMKPSEKFHSRLLSNAIEKKLM